MYRYDAIDQAVVDERVAEYRDQVARFMDGRIGEDEFRPLRLKNGLYHQLHAYMLRVAIPYGLMTSTQLHALAQIARDYDKGFGHFTTRQNIQYNWPKLEETPAILADLARVQIHAIQTSGSVVRNISADHLAGIADDEIEDPRPWCEILRQWSTLHPEFSFLPRKFKIAFSGSPADRAATAVHDIGFRLHRHEGRAAFAVIVGGGLGRTPLVGPVIEEHLDPKHLLSYTAAILRVYNLEGNRENLFKARIKILVRDLGAQEFARRVNDEHARIKDDLVLSDDEIARVKAHFTPPTYRADVVEDYAERAAGDKDFARWLKYNTVAHKVPGYRAAFVSLKGALKGSVNGGVRAPGDITADEMSAVADLAARYSFGLVRATHTQNLLLGDVEGGDLYALWQALRAWGLAVPNIGTLQDIICCPGLDYCNLANATSIPVAKAITERFDDLDFVYDVGDIKLKISGCINSCGHHHVGNIGILGVDMKGVEAYQIMLGGSEEADATLGKWIGPAVEKENIVGAVEKIVRVYVEQRHEDERFLDTVRRIGLKPFAERVYA